MSTIECSWRLWPTPGMYVVTSIPFVSRTRATFRRAELGFFGVDVKTRTQTPRFWGLEPRSGLFVRPRIRSRPHLTNWLIVGIRLSIPNRVTTNAPKRPQHAPGAREDNPAPDDREHGWPLNRRMVAKAPRAVKNLPCKN